MDTALPRINALAWNIAKIGADRVWNELGINGSGIVVGGLDTGVRYTPEVLRANYKCAGMTNHSACWKDAMNNRTTPYDDFFHGTHTMGSAVGQNGVGVAPGAKWIACKALSSSGSTTDIFECFDWFPAPGGNPANAPDVVVNSWGGSGISFQQGMTNWVNAGLFPEFSNGNSGPGCGTVQAPASYRNAFGVGSTDRNDVIANSSSRGPSSAGMKPQVSAPGVSIRSATNGSDTSYGTYSGTSMAGPWVGGLVALLLDANPNLTIAQLTSNIQNNALGIPSTACSSSGVPNNVYGYGRIRAYESVKAIMGGITPTPVTTTPVTRTPTPATVTPTPGFSDDFESDKGWTVNPNGGDTSTTGRWERGDPEATSDNALTMQLGSTTSGSNDLVTGRLAGASVGDYDLDGGLSSIRSPRINLPASDNLTLSLRYYLAHASNASSDDYLRVSIVADMPTGAQPTVVFEKLGAASEVSASWATATIDLSSYAGQTVRILIEVADTSSGSLLEAAIDDAQITRQ